MTNHSQETKIKQLTWLFNIENKTWINIDLFYMLERFGDAMYLKHKTRKGLRVWKFLKAKNKEVGISLLNE